MMTTGRGIAAAAVGIAAVLGVAACGTSTAAGGPGSAASRPVAVLPMPTSVTSPDGTSWAAVEMGGSAAQHNNFWELFVRPTGGTKWKLVTPPGVASNGGLAAASTGARSVAAAFLPSQDLIFSPVSTTTDGGAQWATSAPVSPGLAATPDALAAGTNGKLLALTAAGDVDASTSLGANWTRLVTETTLAASPAGRGCGLTALTATGWTTAGAALLAGTCSKPSRAGIFTQSGNGWQDVGPTLPAALAHGPVEVLAAATAGTRLTAIVATGTGSASALVAAWSGDGGSHWSLSPSLPAGPGVARSLSIWSNGTAGIVLSGRRGETIGWQGSSWRALPTLPDGTATLAEGSGTELVALAAHAGTLTAWQLPAGGTSWALTQTTQVPVPYGSSS
jgi:hypothetical protein